MEYIGGEWDRKIGGGMGIMYMLKYTKIYKSLYVIYKKEID